MNLNKLEINMHWLNWKNVALKNIQYCLEEKKSQNNPFLSAEEGHAEDQSIN